MACKSIVGSAPPLRNLIWALIDETGLGPGERLPSERDLALRFGVSRQSLRKALIALEIEGRVEIRGGSGVYVCRTLISGALFASLEGVSPEALMQARTVFEHEVVLLAAANVDRIWLQRLSEALSAMRGGRRRQQIDAERRFHLCIAKMAGNSVLVGMVGALFDGQHSAIASCQGKRAHARRPALAEHEAIYRALEDRNPHVAAVAMSNHLIASLDRWLASQQG
jgi:DNA-binding FadR family transcriptional regulator